MSDSSYLHDVVTDFLSARGIEFDRVDDETYLFRLRGSDAEWFVSLSVVAEHEQVIVYAELPVDVDGAHRPGLAVWAARANRGLPIGNFEVDLDDGGVWAKTSLDVEGDELTDALLQNVVGSNHALVDRHLGGLRRWLAGGLDSPEAAVDAAR